MDNVDRFVILKDKTYTLNPPTQNAALGSCQTLREIKMNKKCNIPLEFSSTTGAITQLESLDDPDLISKELDDYFTNYYSRAT